MYLNYTSRSSTDTKQTRNWYVYWFLVYSSRNSNAGYTAGHTTWALPLQKKDNLKKRSAICSHSVCDPLAPERSLEQSVDPAKARPAAGSVLMGGQTDSLHRMVISPLFINGPLLLVAQKKVRLVLFFSRISAKRAYIDLVVQTRGSNCCCEVSFARWPHNLCARVNKTFAKWFAKSWRRAVREDAWRATVTARFEEFSG